MQVTFHKEVTSARELLLPPPSRSRATRGVVLLPLIQGTTLTKTVVPVSTRLSGGFLIHCQDSKAPPSTVVISRAGSISVFVCMFLKSKDNSVSREREREVGRAKKAESRTRPWELRAAAANPCSASTCRIPVASAGFQTYGLLIMLL